MKNRKYLGLSAGFSKQVGERLGIGKNGQLTKVWGDDFRVRLCWEFWHLVKGVGFAR